MKKLTSECEALKSANDAFYFCSWRAGERKTTNGVKEDERTGYEKIDVIYLRETRNKSVEQHARAEFVIDSLS